MTIYEALKRDHDNLKPLLAKLVEKTEREEDVTDLLAKIEDELIPHSRAEEAVFYNSIRNVSSGQKEALHGYKEHAEAETLLQSLKMMDKVGAEGPKLAKKLQEALEHHIKEEETEVFAVARSVLVEGEAEKMAEAFERLKPEVREESSLRNSINLIANLMPGRFGDALKSYEIKR